MPLFKVGLPELEFDGGELALQDPDQEVPAAARRLQEAGVNALGLGLDEVEHRFDHPGGVNTSPWSATRFFDLIRLMGQMHSDYWLVATSTNSTTAWLFGLTDCPPRRFVRTESIDAGKHRVGGNGL